MKIDWLPYSIRIDLVRVSTIWGESFRSFVRDRSIINLEMTSRVF